MNPLVSSADNPDPEIKVCTRFSHRNLLEISLQKVMFIKLYEFFDRWSRSLYNNNVSIDMFLSAFLP